MRKLQGSNPEALRPSPAFETGRGHSSNTFPDGCLAGPIRRTTFALGGQRSVPLSYGEVATRGQIPN